MCSNHSPTTLCTLAHSISREQNATRAVSGGLCYRCTEVGTPLRTPLFITWMVLLIAPVRGSYLFAVHRRQDSCRAVCSLDFLVCLCTARTRLSAVTCTPYTCHSHSSHSDCILHWFGACFMNFYDAKLGYCMQANT